jgi:hypothetical protein
MRDHRVLQRQHLRLLARQLGYGINAYSTGDGGSIDISTSATSSIDTYAYDGDAIGIYAYSTGAGADMTIDNAGSIDSYSGLFHTLRHRRLPVRRGRLADHLQLRRRSPARRSRADTYGIAGEVGCAGSGDLEIHNSGSISLYSAEDARASGPGLRQQRHRRQQRGSIYATSAVIPTHLPATFSSGNIYVDNSGSIDVYAVAPPSASPPGASIPATSTSQRGSIYAYSSDDEATGIYAYARYGNIYIDNSGSIETYSDDEGYGIDAYAYGDGNITITSSGPIL